MTATTRLRLAVLVAVAAVIALIVWRHERSASLPAGAAATALRARLHTPYRFRCHSEHNDGTIALSGVDYFCLPIHHPSG